MPFDSPGEGSEGDEKGKSRWGNPERTLPDDPERRPPDVPAPDTDESEVDPDLRTAFWRSVALANVALGGVAVGPMLVYFEGMWVAGSAAVVVGVLAALRIRQHRRVVEQVAGDGEREGATDATAEGTGAADPEALDRHPAEDPTDDPTTERND